MQTSSLTLRKYQVDCIEAIEAAETRGIRRQLVSMPTGSGKTIIFVDLIRRRPGRALVLAHRDELISQAVGKCRVVDPDGDIGIVQAERDEVSARTVVASVQTLVRPNRLARVTPDFDTVIVDEGHHATAPSYRTILERVRAFANDGPLLVGWTATPKRADGHALGDIFEEITFETKLLDMINARYLADLRAIQIRVQVDLNQIHVRHGDLAVDELSDVLTEANAPTQVALAYREHAAARKGLVFTPGVRLAHETAAALNHVGIIAAAIDGTTETETRREILTRLSTGRIQVICNCGVLTEGYDEPSVDCIVIARPTKSRSLYVQMVGRGSRRHPGKDDCLILDLVGVTDRHDLQTAATLFGFEPDDLAEMPLTEAVARRRHVAETPTASGPLVARPVELFRQGALHWVTSGATQHALSVGDGLLILRSDDLVEWRVEYAPRHRRREVLATGLTLAYAQGVAEDKAREFGAGVLVSRQASWRRQPVTSKQLSALRRWRIPVKAHLSKGEASDLLTEASARAVS